MQDCLPFRLASAYRRVDRIVNRGLAPLELTHAHGHLLVCLFQHGEMRLIDLARRTGLEPSTVSRLTRNLSDRKLVRRRGDPKDGRAHLLRVAARAKVIRADLERVMRRADERLRRSLTTADLRAFLSAADIMDQLP
jgi:DNA-binding MarR family transcriptional regulator